MKTKQKAKTDKGSSKPKEESTPIPATSKFQRILAEYNLRRMNEPNYQELTLKRISELANVSGPTVSAIYHNVKRRYGIRTLRDVAATVGATAEDIRP